MISFFNYGVIFLSVFLSFVGLVLVVVYLFTNHPRQKEIENDLRRGAEFLKEDVDQAKGFICILSDRCCAEIYKEDSGVPDAFRKAHNRGVKIKVLAGPEVEGGKGNNLFKLAEDGVLELRFTQNPNSPHFRVVDTYVYDEKPHNYKEGEFRSGTRHWNKPALALKFKNEFNRKWYVATPDYRN